MIRKCEHLHKSSFLPCCWSGWFMCLLSQCHNSPLSVNITQIHILCTADSPEIRPCSAQQRNKTKSWQHNLKKDWSHRECCSWRNHKTSETMYFGQMRPKMTFGHDARHHVWQKPNTAYQHKHLIPAVKHGGEQWWFGLALHLLSWNAVWQAGDEDSKCRTHRLRGWTQNHSFICWSQKNEHTK